jgi:integrase
MHPRNFIPHIKSRRYVPSARLRATIDARAQSHLGRPRWCGIGAWWVTYACDHEAASIRRCWSTWNVLCTFLYTGEQLAANPMQLVGRPKLAKPLPKALPRSAVEALLETVARDQDSQRQTDWKERGVPVEAELLSVIEIYLASRDPLPWHSETEGHHAGFRPIALAREISAFRRA